GRWYASSSLNGPWAFSTNSLPADFAKIPADSPRANVLSSVPGTPQAQYMAAASQIPQIAKVDPANTKLTVTYAGDPKFEPITGTTLQYAVNTSYDVIKLSDTLYYSCYSGIWFVAGSPSGPWTVASSVPSVIYTIPPNSPLYQDTCVYIYNENGAPA